MSRRLVLDDGRTQRELVVKERMLVGRDPSCDITDSDPRLSRRHAEFVASPAGLSVRDLDSRNGVRVNGRLVREALLSPGDLVEIGHLAVRFVDDGVMEPAGVARPSGPLRPVDEVQVRAGFEDDRTRVLPPPMSTQVSGPIPPVPPAALRSAGDIPIVRPEPTVRVRRPRTLSHARLSVLDLMATPWGWRVLGQGVLLAGIVFLMTVLPMLSWIWQVSGPVSTGTLVRMLAAPLLAALFAGLMVSSLIARTTARGLETDDDA
ncbi:MAG TPA: FHA domain-containing protein [Vicinamibacterales bacterium]